MPSLRSVEPMATARKPTPKIQILIRESEMDESLTNGLLTEGQAAQILSCSVALLRKWRLYGQGPTYVKVGRLVRYKQSDLTVFILENTVQRT